MDDDFSSDGELSEKYLWPKINWNLDFWFTLIPFILGFLLLFYPQIQVDKNLEKIRWLIGIGLLMFPLTATLVIWFVNIVRVIIRRNKDFKLYFNQFQDLNKEYIEYRDKISNAVVKLISSQSLQVSEAHFDDNEIYVVVKSSPQIELNNGIILVLYNAETEKTIGFFKVTSITAEYCQAKAYQGVDPLWSGYVREKKHIRFLANINAVVYSEGE
jgi:hypothetical protein